MVTPEKSKLYSLEEFMEFVARPENADRLFELLNGEIIEVMPGRTYNSGIGHLLVVPVHLFCREQGVPCYTSGGDGAYRVGSNVVAPDFAYKRTPLSKEYPDPDPPLWAVEVLSPTDEPAEIEKKRKIYRQAGILLWEIDPEKQTVDVYAPGQSTRTFNIDDTLDGGKVLPGFTLPMRELFSS